MKADNERIELCWISFGSPFRAVGNHLPPLNLTSLTLPQVPPWCPPAKGVLRNRIHSPLVPRPGIGRGYRLEAASSGQGGDSRTEEGHFVFLTVFRACGTVPQASIV